ncbi:hypothetical protein PHLH3_27230 [Pseudomonas sp. St386]|nr:hypothetical protein PHLH3_27230 [Pseudomonas sp. St386]
MLVCSFVVAGIWLQWIEGYRITSLVDTAGLPDILGKSVVREAGAWMANYGRYPWLWLLPALGLAGAAGAALLLMRRRTLCAFVASSLAVVGVISTAGVSMFPFVMPSSSMPAASLTVWDSVSSHLSLAIMFWATLFFMPLIVIYTAWAYRVMRGKVTATQIKANEHSAY